MISAFSCRVDAAVKSFRFWFSSVPLRFLWSRARDPAVVAARQQHASAVAVMLTTSAERRLQSERRARSRSAGVGPLSPCGVGGGCGAGFGSVSYGEVSYAEIALALEQVSPPVS